MKGSHVLIVALFGLGTLANAQSTTGRVGINTSTPTSTLDIRGKKGTTDVDGLQAPRLTRAELTAKGNSLYSAEQAGTLLYITDISSGDTASQRLNITTTGYYVFDGSVWNKLVIGTPRIGPGSYTSASDGAASSKLELNQKTESVTNTRIDGKDVYAYKGTFTTNGDSAAVTIPAPAGLTSLYKITIYNTTGTIVGSSLYSYNKATQNNNAITGEPGMSSIYPAATYSYVMEYLK